VGSGLGSKPGIFIIILVYFLSLQSNYQIVQAAVVIVVVGETLKTEIRSRVSKVGQRLAQQRLVRKAGPLSLKTFR